MDTTKLRDERRYYVKLAIVILVITSIVSYLLARALFVGATRIDQARALIFSVVVGVVISTFYSGLLMIRYYTDKGIAKRRRSLIDGGQYEI